MRGIDAIKSRQLNTDSPPDHTLRMVCPTRFLSLHGCRCAWLLVPEQLRNTLSELHLNLHVEDSWQIHCSPTEPATSCGKTATMSYWTTFKRNYQRLLNTSTANGHFDAETG